MGEVGGGKGGCFFSPGCFWLMLCASRQQVLRCVTADLAADSLDREVGQRAVSRRRCTATSPLPPGSSGELVALPDTTRPGTWLCHRHHSSSSEVTWRGFAAFPAPNRPARSGGDHEFVSLKRIFLFPWMKPELPSCRPKKSCLRSPCDWWAALAQGKKTQKKQLGNCVCFGKSSLSWLGITADKVPL